MPTMLCCKKVLTLVVCLSFAGLSPWVFSASAAPAEPIRIGFPSFFTGVGAPLSEDMFNGYNLYLKEVGNTVAGRKIEVIREDTEGNPSVGLTKVRKLVEHDRVHIVSGILNSAVAYAVADYVVQHEVPLIITNAGADGLTQQKRNPYVFRTSFSDSQVSHPFGEWVSRKLGYRKIVTLGADYSAGHEHVRGFQRTFKEAGGEVVQEFWTPMGTNDYAPYLSRIRSDVDAMFVFLFGSDAIRLIKQYREYGLKEKIPLLGKDITDEMILNQIGDNAVGIITAQCYSTALDTPANKAFMSAFKKAFSREPTFYAENGYTGAKVLMEALRAVKGNVEDKAGFLKALRDIKLDDTPRGPIRFDTYQNVVCATYIRRVEKVGGQYQNTVIETIPNVSQFWKWSPEEYLKTTRYTR